MSEPAVRPERITKPIQLLGAWLAGLLSIDACFLIAASRFPVGSWASDALVSAAIGNVPLFLLAVFLLQTKFRPEMQEDAFYSTYLSRKTNERVVLSKDDIQFSQLIQKLAKLESSVAAASTSTTPSQQNSALSVINIGVNKFLGDKSAIEERLSDLGLLGYSEFGGASPPQERAVAVSKYLSKSSQRAVLQLAKELGFYQYTLFDNVAEETSEDVLFGSYGSDLQQIA